MLEGFNAAVANFNESTAGLTGALNDFFGAYVAIVLVLVLLGTGLYLTAGLRAWPWRHIPTGFRRLFRSATGKEKLSDEDGEISPFQALMTALSATVGTGNIAGVATAIFLGGPGAIFWMWVTAMFGMATKYSEAVLAVKYREVDERGKHVGGPMYYIKNGMGPKWAWLGTVFAFVAMFTAFGVGNLIQSNSVAQVAQQNFGIAPILSGLLAAILAGMVLIGGIESIGKVAGKLVPVMALFYISGALIVLAVNVTEIPGALALIVTDAFTGTAATGGFAGATVMAAIRFGVARGIFSNEAGLGSAAIAHAAAKTNDPVRQGSIGMLGTFIDTIIICTMTALVIVISGQWTSGLNAAELSAAAFGASLPGGQFIVTFSLMVFAFTTVLGWAYYGERCAEYLFGVRIIKPYRAAWCIVIVFGALLKVDLAWIIADFMNAAMAFPNLIALVVLSPIVFKITREHLDGPKDPDPAHVEAQ